MTHWKRPWCYKRSKAGGEGMTEDEMVGWHLWVDGHEFEQTLGVANGQGSLECFSLWGHKDSDTEWLDWTELRQNRTLPQGWTVVSWLFITCLCIPLPPRLATVWICSFELREVHGALSLFPINKEWEQRKASVPRCCREKQILTLYGKLSLAYFSLLFLLLLLLFLLQSYKMACPQRTLPPPPDF